MSPEANFVAVAGLAGTAALCLAVAFDGLGRRGGLIGMRLALTLVAVSAAVASICLLGAAQEDDPANAIRWHVGIRAAIGGLGAGALGAAAALMRWRPMRALWIALGCLAVLVVTGVVVALRLTPADLVRTPVSWFPTRLAVRLFDTVVVAGASTAVVAGALSRLRSGERYGRRAMKVLVTAQGVVALLYFAMRMWAPPFAMQAFASSLTGISAIFFWVLLREWRVAGVGSEAFHLLFRTLSLPSVAVDLHTDAALLNPAASSLFGPDASADAVLRRLGLTGAGEAWLRAHSGQRIDQVRIDGAPGRQFELLVHHDPDEAIGLLVLMDVTEQVEHARSLSLTLSELRQMQERLVMNEKMAALGVLVAGVNHEINNPLAYASSNLHVSRELAEVLLEGVPLARKADPTTAEGAALHAWAGRREVRDAEEDLLAALREAEDGCARIQETVASMRLLSRQSDAPEPIDLAEVVQAGVRIGRTSLSPGVEVQVELPATLPIRAVAGELSRLVTNLLVNAGHAMGAAGQIQIRAWQEENEAVLEVHDTGPGVPPELRARIFEPFFTTKAHGVGTGLGLAISYETARRHGGHLHLMERDGPGACFQLRLPMLAET